MLGQITEWRWQPSTRDTVSTGMGRKIDFARTSLLGCKTVTHRGVRLGRCCDINFRHPRQKGIEPERQGAGVLPAARIIEVEAAEGQAPVAQHTLKPPFGHGGSPPSSRRSPWGSNRSAPRPASACETSERRPDGRGPNSMASAPRTASRSACRGRCTECRRLRGRTGAGRRTASSRPETRCGRSALPPRRRARGRRASPCRSRG